MEISPPRMLSSQPVIIVLVKLQVLSCFLSFLIFSLIWFPYFLFSSNLHIHWLVLRWLLLICDSLPFLLPEILIVVLNVAPVFICRFLYEYSHFRASLFLFLWLVLGWWCFLWQSFGLWFGFGFWLGFWIWIIFQKIGSTWLGKLFFKLQLILLTESLPFFDNFGNQIGLPHSGKL